MAAASTIDSELFFLQDHWPGSAIPGLVIPDRITGTDGADQHAGHNVASPQYDVGAKMKIYNDGTVGQRGESTLTYLQLGTAHATSTITAKSLCVPDSATLWYQVTNDPDDCINLPSGRMAYAPTAMTDEHYGWFWTGGVCPEAICPSLGGNYTTSGTVVFGSITAVDTTEEHIVLGALLADMSCMAGGQAQSADA